MRVSKTLLFSTFVLGLGAVQASKSAEGLSQIGQGIQQIGQGALNAVDQKRSQVQQVGRFLPHAPAASVRS